MSLASITTIPLAPRTEEEKETSDYRYKLVLLNRQRDTFRVLAIPYGADLQARVEVPSAVCLKASSTETQYSTLTEPRLSIVRCRDYKYPVIEIDRKKRIIPYRTKSEFPTNYSDNRFYACLQEQTNEVCKRADEFLSIVRLEELSSSGIWKAMRDVTISGDERGVNQLERIHEEMRDLSKYLPQKVYDLVAELFCDEPNPSSRMRWYERRPRHFCSKTLEVPEDEKKQSLTLILLANTLMHPVSPTLQKRNFLLRKYVRQESSRKRNQESISAISEMYPRIYRQLKSMNDKEDDNASKRFRNLAVLAGLGTMAINPYVGLGVISYGIIDRFFAKHHAKSGNTYTGLIGQVRDRFTPEELRDFYFFDVSKKGNLI
ncbi:MAG: hypothetical protein KKE50_00215 [Nanoarchaeota archaeon]|nr:hypothetical protein [Nanoarchaeota archaeon]